MSVILKKDTWKIKDPNTGEYRDSSVFATTLTEDVAAAVDAQETRAEEIVSDLSSSITAQETRADGIVSGAQADIDTIAAAVQSMTQTGTDTTLTVPGAAADSKTVGDEVSELKTAFDYDVKTVFNSPKSFSLGLVVKGQLNPNGANGTDNTKFTRTGYITFTESMICYMANSNYNFCIWGYPNQSISGRVDGFTHSAYVSGDTTVMMQKTSNSRYFRIGFTRKDGAVLTTDLTDPTSDFSIITASLKFYTMQAPLYDLYPNGTTASRGTEISDIINQKGKCSLAPGDYYLGRLYVPEGGIIIGAGKDKTRLISISTQYYGIRLRANCFLSNLTLEGQQANETPIEDYTQGVHGIQIGDTESATTDAYNCTLENILVTNFTGCGIFIRHVGQGLNGSYLSNIKAQYCSAGFYLGEYGEFNILKNCRATYCYTGAVVMGGNNILSECSFGYVENGINLAETDTYGSTNNDAHGIIANTKITHTGYYSGTDGISFVCGAQASGEIITGCMFASLVDVKDRGKGLQFSGCQFRGDNAITIDNSIVLVTGSVFVTSGITGITVLNGGKFIRESCLDFNGNVLASVT